MPNPPAFIIRPFTPHDQHAARALILEGLGAHFGFIDETLNPDVDNIAANYLDKHYPFVVAECASQLVGTGGLIDEGQTGQMVRVSVHKAHHRQGIGRAIVQHLVTMGRQRQMRYIWIETTTGWQDAIGLYESCGFKIFEMDDDHTYLKLTLR